MKHNPDAETLDLRNFAGELQMRRMAASKRLWQVHLHLKQVERDLHELEENV